MASYSYDRLSFLDNSFLLMETPNSPMHVAGVATMEAESLTRPEGGIDIDKVRAYVDSRLHLIPRYRQRLAFMPLESRPVWVDDAHFNINYHVRNSALPKPGGERQLKRLAARIMSQRLDRAKPLWEIWVVEGLDGGSRMALITKVHHCMVDGMASVDLMNVLLQLEPDDEIRPAPEWIPRPAPTQLDLSAEGLMRLMKLPFQIGYNLQRVVQAVQDPRSDTRSHLRALRDMLGRDLRIVSETPLNKPIGPHRRFDWYAMSLAEVKEVKNRVGGTVNDVVLATACGAVRRFLERRRINVDVLDFRVMAPVSVRAEGEQGTLGNRVSAWIVPMPLGERDPRRAMEKIRETTADLKESKQAMGAEVLTGVGEWTPSTLLSLGARMITRALPFNLVVTNVPGPQVPLYMLGARMLDTYGLVPLVGYLCLGIVLFSYDGKLNWGFTCDWDLLPDLHDFVLDVEASFGELRQAAAELPLRQKPKKARRRPRVVRGYATRRQA